MNIKILLQSIVIGLTIIAVVVSIAIFANRFVVLWVFGITVFFSVVYATYKLLSDLADK